MEALKLSKERLEVFQKNADFESEVVAPLGLAFVPFKCLPCPAKDAAAECGLLELLCFFR